MIKGLGSHSRIWDFLLTIMGSHTKVLSREVGVHFPISKGQACQGHTDFQ